MTTRYLSGAAIGRRLGYGRHAVATWRDRFKDTPTPFPAPDVTVGDDEGDSRSVPGWAEDRMDEIRRWKDSLPGQGSGGGRPRKDRPEDQS